jgi:hypothetical protein
MASLAVWVNAWAVEYVFLYRFDLQQADIFLVGAVVGFTVSCP